MKTLTTIRFNYCFFLLSIITLVYLLSVSASVAAPAMNQPTAWLLNSEQWELNRTGNSIVKMPVLNQVVTHWIKRVKTEPGVKIELQYPGGEDGEVWVQELADWLVSLGISSSHILMLPGSRADDVIKLSIVSS